MTQRNAKRNARIVELYRQGLTYSQIGEQLWISRNVVAGVINRNAMIVPRRMQGTWPLYDESACVMAGQLHIKGLTQRQISEQLNIPLCGIPSLLRRAGIYERSPSLKEQTREASR